MKQKLPQSVRASLVALVIINLASILGIIFLHWSSAFILLAYWLESLVIGFYTLLKMGKASKIGDIKSTVNGKPVPTSKSGLMLFFIFHYGFFMLGHLIFLLAITLVSSSFTQLLNLFYWLPVFFAGLLISHGISYKQNFIGNKEYESQTAGGLMIKPYKRIIPMHLTIMFGFILGSPAILLVILKTFIDAYSHISERKNAGTMEKTRLLPALSHKKHTSI
jgi:hypothetical protein